jgi:hypothetical protein
MFSCRPPHSSRTDRSPETAQRAQRSRERVHRRRNPARERDGAIAAAGYLSGWQAITAYGTKHDARIAELRRRSSVVEDEAAARIAGSHVDQGWAAMIIPYQPGHVDDDVAHLLKIIPEGSPSTHRTRSNAGRYPAWPAGGRRTGIHHARADAADRGRTHRHRRHATTDCSRLPSADRAVVRVSGLLLTSAIGRAGALKQGASNCPHQPALKLERGRQAGRFETRRSDRDCAGREIGVSVDRCDGRLAGETIGRRCSGRPARHGIGTAGVTTAVVLAHPRWRVWPERGSTAMAIELGAPPRVCVPFRDIAGSRHG